MHEGIGYRLPWAYRISTINSPGELFFQHHLLRGSHSRGGVIQEGELFFQCHFFTFDRTKFIFNCCKTKLFRSQNEIYSHVHDELPGELFEGGSYFSMSVRRGGGGGEELIERGSYSRKYGISSFFFSFLRILRLRSPKAVLTRWWGMSSLDFLKFELCCATFQVSNCDFT